MMSVGAITSTAGTPAAGDYVELEQSGVIVLDGDFFISGIHNHYPSGGSPQSFAASIEIFGADKKHKARIKFANFRQHLRNDGIVEEIVPPPVMIEEVLQVTQPLTSLPLWEMVLTKLPAGSYAICYTVSETKSWAFLRPNKSPLRHKIGS